MCKSELRTNLSWLSYWISSCGRKVILSELIPEEVEGDHSPFKSSFWPLGWKSLDIRHSKKMNLFLWDFMRSKNPILRRNKSILCLSAIAWLAVRNVITNLCSVFYVSVSTHSVYAKKTLLLFSFLFFSCTHQSFWLQGLLLSSPVLMLMNIVDMIFYYFPWSLSLTRFPPLH